MTNNALKQLLWRLIQKSHISVMLTGVISYIGKIILKNKCGFLIAMGFKPCVFETLILA